VLKKFPWLELVAQESDGLEAVQKSKELQPDLVLLDIGLPMLNGIEAARRIRDVSPASRIVFVTDNNSWDIAEEALRAGGSGYVVKSKAASELLLAAEAVLQSKPFLSAGLKDVDPDHLKKESAAASCSAGKDCCVIQTSERQIVSNEVRLYPDDEALADSFAHSIQSALTNGNTVVVAVTPSQRASILQRLSSNGVNVTDAIERNLYVQLDVAVPLSRLGRDSSNDENGFVKFVPLGIREAIHKAKASNLHVAVG